MLQIRNLKKQYAAVKAVDDVSITIAEGSIFGLLGPNGAGKSSLLRMVTGITIPDSGDILLNGEHFSLEKHSPLIGYMPEERGLYKKMKVAEQALYLGQLKGLSQSDANQKMNYWFKKLDMLSWKNKKVEDLSKGMSQKLQFVITVMHNPRLLILDEPFSGLDPVNSAIIKDEIFSLAQQGTSIIFSTHRMEQVEEICREIALINKGKLILNGPVRPIREQFRQNQYELEADGTLQGYDQQILERHDNRLILQLANEQDANQLLTACLQQQLRIKRFCEILPSLNDIFIRLVEDDGAVRTFDDANLSN